MRLKGLTPLAPAKSLFSLSLLFVLLLLQSPQIKFPRNRQRVKGEKKGKVKKSERIKIHEEPIVFLKQRDISMKESSISCRRKKGFRMVRNGIENGIPKSFKKGEERKKTLNDKQVLDVQWTGSSIE